MIVKDISSHAFRVRFESFYQVMMTTRAMIGVERGFR